MVQEQQQKWFCVADFSDKSELDCKHMAKNLVHKSIGELVVSVRVSSSLSVRK